MPNGFNNPFFDEYAGASFGTDWDEFVSSQPPSYQSETFNELVLMNNAINEYLLNNPIGSYDYSSMDNTVLGALQNVFGEFSMPYDVQAMQDLYASDYTNPALTIAGGVEAMLDQNVLNIGDGLEMVNILDPASIALSLSELAEVDDPIRAGEVRALTADMLKKTGSEYYKPYEDIERQGLVGEKVQDIAQTQTGGFAGSGARESGLSSAERMYESGYGDILKDIMKMRGQATDDVMDIIYGWQELMGDQ